MESGLSTNHARTHPHNVRTLAHNVCMGCVWRSLEAITGSCSSSSVVSNHDPRLLSRASVVAQRPRGMRGWRPTHRRGYSPGEAPQSSLRIINLNLFFSFFHKTIASRAGGGDRPPTFYGRLLSHEGSTKSIIIALVSACLRRAAPELFEVLVEPPVAVAVILGKHIGGGCRVNRQTQGW
jgi:hypothetical protein